MYLYVYTGGTICLYCTYRRSAEERKRKESKIQCSLRVRPVSCLAAFGVENCYGYHHTSLLADMWARESGWSPTCQMTAAQTSPRLARYLSKSNQQKPPSLSLSLPLHSRERDQAKATMDSTSNKMKKMEPTSGGRHGTPGQVVGLCAALVTAMAASLLCSTSMALTPDGTLSLSALHYASMDGWMDERMLPPIWLSHRGSCVFSAPCRAGIAGAQALLQWQQPAADDLEAHRP